MAINHKYASITIAFFVLVVFQSFTSPAPVFRYMVPAFVVFAAAVSVYNARYLKSIGKFNWWVLLRPALLLCATFALFLILPNAFLRGLFLIGAMLLVAFLEYFLGNFSENVLLNETLIIVFGWFTALSAYDYPYFPKFHLLYLASVFTTAFLATRALYEFLPRPASYKTAASLAIALFCVEIFWALSFLPFHFSALALLLFNFYYLAVILTFYSAYHTLTPKKVQLHAALFVGCMAVVLLATPWRTLQ